jgi:hypothetical protein
VFSEEELQKINGGKGKHTGLIKDNFMIIYKRLIDVSQCKVEKLKELGRFGEGGSRKVGKSWEVALERIWISKKKKH